ncbi:MAG: hemagglutinin repeat-containing protein [Polaromonas sp.]|nr:hemagglutinin repeat-containing protein [Polaromonas sp.]
MHVKPGNIDGGGALISGRSVDMKITARAARLSAGDTLTLDASRNLTLYAGQNQTSAETSHATKNGMRHHSLDATGQETSLARTTLNAADIQLCSGNDTVLAAIEANASTLDIQAGGKLIFATQTTTNAASRQEAKGDAAAGKGHVDETTHYNQLNVGTLKIVTKGGVTAQMASATRKPRWRNSPAWAGSTRSPTTRPWPAWIGRRCRRLTTSGSTDKAGWGR